jgi:DNA-binding transcriptional regulator YbjK
MDPADAQASPAMPKGQQAIMQAVVHVVAQKGLRGLTFRSVAAEAGVSPTLAAHYFKTRDELIKATLTWVANYAVDSTHLRSFLSEQQDYENALAWSIENEPDLHAFQIEMILEARRRPELKPALVDLYTTYLSALKSDAEILGLASLSEAAYRAVFAGIDGLILQYFIGAISIEQFRESTLVLWDSIPRATSSGEVTS